MDDPTRYLPATESPASLAVLFGSALLEYVFPPFPGDTVVVFGAFLVTARGWSGPGVFAATTAGSLVGAAVDWYVGVALQRWRHRRTPLTGAGDSVRQTVDGLVERFQRHGPAYILVNRFLPGIRALFFVAAGMAGMRPGPVLLYAAVSAIAWNCLLMGAGLAVGASWDTLPAWFAAYTRVVWGILGAALLVALAVAFLRRRKAGPR